jgi:hypothetical protein
VASCIPARLFTTREAVTSLEDTREWVHSLEGHGGKSVLSFSVFLHDLKPVYPLAGGEYSPSQRIRDELKEFGTAQKNAGAPKRIRRAVKEFGTK